MERIIKFTPEEVKTILVAYCGAHGYKVDETSKVNFRIKEVIKGHQLNEYRTHELIEIEVCTNSKV